AYHHGVVYFGANDNRLYAVNATTGTEMWNYTTGDSVRSSPAVAGDMVIFGSDDGFIYALRTEDGSRVWRYQTSGAVSSSPAVWNGMVFVGSMDGTMYAVNLTTGAEIWKYATGDGIWSSPAVVNGSVIFGSFDGYLYALRADTGSPVWKIHVGGVAQSSPAVGHRLITVGAAGGWVYAIGEAPDLSIENMKVSISQPQVGSPVAVEVTVANSGTKAANATLRLYDGEVSLGGYAIGTKNISLEPGALVNISFVWKPMFTGNRTMIANLTGILPHDASEENNEKRIIVNVQPETTGWAVEQGDIAHTGYYQGTGPNRNTLAWSYPMKAPASVSPIAARYIYTAAGNRVFSIMKTTWEPGVGHSVWSVTLQRDVLYTPTYMNNAVFLATEEQVYAIDALDRHVIWKRPYQLTSHMVPYNGTLYAPTSDGRVIGITGLNGSLVWEVSAGNITTPVSISNGLLVAASSSQLTVYSTEDAAALWSYELPSPPSGAPTVYNDVVYISLRGGELLALELVPDDTDEGVPNPGEAYDLLWRQELQSPLTGSPAAGNGIVVVKEESGNLTAFLLNGEAAWTVHLESWGTGSPVVTRNKVYVGGSSLYCLDSTTGAVLWSYALGDASNTTPALTDGILVAVDAGGTVYAFNTSEFQPPVARISSPEHSSTFRIGEDITFDASASTDDGVIHRYVWTFGDGGYAEGVQVVYNYTDTGTFNVTLTVYDNEVPPLTNVTRISISINPNTAPHLRNGAVSRTEGTNYTLFNFSVEYMDPEGDEPAWVRVKVGNTFYNMTPGPELPDGWRKYYCATTLETGRHAFAFYTSDGVLESSLPCDITLTVWQIDTYTKNEISIRIMH
ncbi:MAG: hypothetical protein DRP62_08875, partial [Planctomycetota bacterium]